MESNPVLKGKKTNKILPLSKYRYSRDCCETFDTVHEWLILML